MTNFEERTTKQLMQLLIAVSVAGVTANMNPGAAQFSNYLNLLMYHLH